MKSFFVLALLATTSAIVLNGDGPNASDGTFLKGKEEAKKTTDTQLKTEAEWNKLHAENTAEAFKDCDTVEHGVWKHNIATEQYKGHEN